MLVATRSGGAVRGTDAETDVAEGDWIEIGQLGAYGGCFRTAFNGFDRARLVEVGDAPLLFAPGRAAAPLLLAA